MKKKELHISTNYIHENLVRSVSLFSPVFAFMLLEFKNLRRGNFFSVDQCYLEHEFLYNFYNYTQH